MSLLVAFFVIDRDRKIGQLNEKYRDKRSLCGWSDVPKNRNPKNDKQVCNRNIKHTSNRFCLFLPRHKKVIILI